LRSLKDEWEKINEVIGEMGRMKEGEAPLMKPLKSKMMDLIGKMRSLYEIEKNLGRKKVEIGSTLIQKVERRGKEEKRDEVRKNVKRWVEKNVKKGELIERIEKGEKKMIWRIKVEEKKEEKETGVSSINSKEMKDEKKENDLKRNFERKLDGVKRGNGWARSPNKGDVAPSCQNPSNCCWICGQPGHRRDECKEKKKFEGKNLKNEKMMNEGKFEKRRNYFQSFCLVHGPCGHSSGECGDVHRALSPIGFFNRSRWLQLQQRNFIFPKKKPLDQR